MQHTLIPLKDRRRLHREYVIRVVITSLFALAVSVAVGAVALFPAYIQAWFYNDAAQSAVAVAREEKADESLEKIKAALSADSKLLKALDSGQDDIRFSGIAGSLAKARGQTRIISFAFSRTGSTTVAVTLKGIAATRGDLIALRGRLEGIMPGTRIEVPIDQLAKNTNLEFTLKFSKQIP